ncbi:hypothetical protein [uncultured Desulfobacter sp.]|uniref:hypothetical protein n=1 Tax=uncultured Desulfobacter sp. TaxID=240139 RepID=UPI0037496D12
MFWHPLLLAVISSQFMALLLLLAACPAWLNTALNWDPLVADHRQLSLETKAEGASILGRAAFGLFLFSGVLLIFGIANIFHEDIPGAMCGTGVCQAMSADGSTRLLLYNGLLIILIKLWYELDKLNRMLAEMPLTEISARLFLTIPVVAVLTLKQTYDSFAGIRPNQPVDCCAVVYDQFSTIEQATTIFGLGDHVWLIAFIVLNTLLLIVSVALSVSRIDRPWERSALAAITWLWLPVSALILVNVLSAYHYEVLHHHCPWCLFLPEHHLVGYPLYGGMAFIGMEGLTLFILPLLVKHDTRIYRIALNLGRQAAKKIAMAQLLFLIIAVLPAIVWRLRYGVWMSG